MFYVGMQQLSKMIYCFWHRKIKFIFSSHHVIFFLQTDCLHKSYNRTCTCISSLVRIWKLHQYTTHGLQVVSYEFYEWYNYFPVKYWHLYNENWSNLHWLENIQIIMYYMYCMLLLDGMFVYWWNCFVFFLTWFFICHLAGAKDYSGFILHTSQQR